MYGLLEFKNKGKNAATSWSLLLPQHLAPPKMLLSTYCMGSISDQIISLGDREAAAC
jgi:hypothetical protein